MATTAKDPLGHGHANVPMSWCVLRVYFVAFLGPMADGRWAALDRSGRGISVTTTHLSPMHSTSSNGVEKNAYKGLIRFQYSHTQTHFAFRISHSAFGILNSTFQRPSESWSADISGDIAGHCWHCFKCPDHNDCCKLKATDRESSVFRVLKGIPASVMHSAGQR